MSNTVVGFLNLFVVAGGALFAYYKFFREGTHHQRIELDIECIDLGVTENYRIIEIGITAENKGNIEQSFDKIMLKVRGIKSGDELHEIKHHEPRLSFPETISEISVISSKYKYFFVRPGVCQRFPVVVKVPISWSHLQARTTFKYFGVNQIHSAERAFELNSKNA